LARTDYQQTFWGACKLTGQKVEIKRYTMSPSNKNQLEKIAKDIHVLKGTSGSAYTPELIDIIVRENENQIIITTIIEHTHLDLKTALLKQPYADMA